MRQMELSHPEDLDVFGLAGDELEAAVQVFHVRSGKVVGRSALFVDKVEEVWGLVREEAVKAQQKRSP